MSWLSELEHVRLEFVLIANEADVSMSEACRQFGISRKTGYKWLSRYRSAGIRGLSNRSCRPHRIASEVSGDIVVEIVRLRQAHPFWGPKKLRHLLFDEGFTGSSLPSVSTIGRILKRCGLSESKGRGRPRRWMSDGDLSEATGPNDVWTIDFKGWWRCGDGSRCEPLTIRDLFSRYLFCVRPMARRRTEDVRAVFEEMFERYGLPQTIRSDNGSPFASMTGPHGLTKLSAWWRILGIDLDRIDPGRPDQNGAHERMHGDMAREIEGMPSETLSEESKRLERWRIEYNVQRPHEALGMKRPGELYRRSAKRLKDMKQWAYPAIYGRRRVRKDGCIGLKGGHVYISEALVGHDVGLEDLEQGGHRVWFCDLAIKDIAPASGASLRPSASASPQTP